jgi:hypothetical protein
MSDAVVTIANNFLDSIHGAGIFYPGKVMIGYNDGPGPYDYLAGWFPNGTEVTPRFADPNDAIQQGVRELLMQTLVIGGDVLQKRAWQAFTQGPHPDPYSDPTNFSDLIHLSGDLRTAQDYEIYLDNREAINAVMAANPDTAFTVGWIATFARVNDLGLNHTNASDFLGGLVGWLDSVKKAGLVFSPAGVHYDAVGTTVLIDIKLANGTFIPGALSAFADQLTQSSDATGTTLHFVLNNAIAPLGFQGPSSAVMVSGEWQVSGSAGNNIWFGTNAAASTFTATGSGNDILIGGSTDEHILAGEGWNFVDGGAGSDTIISGSGSDILHGGPGHDYLAGGGGNDSYTFSRGDGADTVGIKA